MFRAEISCFIIVLILMREHHFSADACVITFKLLCSVKEWLFMKQSKKQLNALVKKTLFLNQKIIAFPAQGNKIKPQQ